MSRAGTASRQGFPIEAERLERGDRILLFGAVVNVLGRQEAYDFPNAVVLLIQRAPDGRPTSTLVPKDMLLLGLSIRRTWVLRCARCEWPTLLTVDLADGMPERGICGTCHAEANVDGEQVSPAPMRRGWRP